MAAHSEPLMTGIMILLPLAAGMVVFQANPYYALVIRGILGAIAALIYALLGAADVALTEALVGTMLAITLYAVAVRSSLVMRLGVLAELCQNRDDNTCDPVNEAPFAEMIAAYRQIIAPYHLRLELVPYPDTEQLTQALKSRVVHGICHLSPLRAPQSFDILVRIPRLFDILQAGLTPNLIHHSRLTLTHPSTATSLDSESVIFPPESDPCD
ncbi:DUF4040 domain-containing protein [Synechococcus sp. PCC 6312]|uniref:DUF4040 domain-containing protein n=1 Tax=Synechococcus sp. (strain ATCC 27167 / PCC 6312) TaxID=195253 RepID=UPI00029ED0B9|nr:DUF4040 domain-containing protein [Synechococcus sp. PCC 6312]AFY62067.1 putative subunit of the multisubunit Na+/H+ antiporter [Synechococcus sp. PCC 6312]